MKKEVVPGTVRIKANDILAYERTEKSWKKAKLDISNIKHIVDLYKANNNFEILVDKKDSKFLKGEITLEGNIRGARINILPNGKKIDKAFSLFAEHLVLHDESSDDHWDVLYRNKGGTYAYCYDLDKKQKHRNEKFQKVWQFDKVHNLLLKKVSSALKDEKDIIALPMYTLLKTYMRVGNEIYYNAHGHKGLTTLKKKDIKINKGKVVFNYFAKDGVPRHIEESFSPVYINRLKKQISKLKANDFVFTSIKTGHPLYDDNFKKAFKKYCGKEFYPHIVRSHYATVKVKNYIKHKRKLQKEEANELFLSIAEKLGHKKFIKKKNEWVNNYNVTINHYIQPSLVEKVKSLVKK